MGGPLLPTAVPDHRRLPTSAIFALAFLAFSRSGGADLSNLGSTRGLDLDPMGRPGFRAGGAISIAASWARKRPASASSSVGSSASSPASTLIWNSTTAPVSDACSHFTGRSGVLGRVIASASRDRRGNRNDEGSGGAEQHADASSGDVATTFPPKTTVLCDDMVTTMDDSFKSTGRTCDEKGNKHEEYSSS